MYRMGVKLGGGGPHQSKTMMLSELALLLGSGAADRAEDAIVRENLLGKPSIRSRQAAFYRLQQLVGNFAASRPSINRRLVASAASLRPSLARISLLSGEGTKR